MVQNLRKHVEEAQEHFRQMKLRYQEMKSEFVTVRDVNLNKLEWKWKFQNLSFVLHSNNGVHV